MGPLGQQGPVQSLDLAVLPGAVGLDEDLSGAEPVYREDRRRANAPAVLGYTLLRFGYEDLVHHEDAVAEVIARVLARGPR